MYDYFSAEADLNKSIRYFGQNDPIEWNGFVFTPIYRGIDIVKYVSDYNGLRLTLYFSKIRIENSLHKFYHNGINHTDFSLSEVRDAINIICDRLGIEAKKFKIKSLEFGLNIIVSRSPLDYINALIAFKGDKRFSDMIDSHKIYGKKCCLSEYILKIYYKYMQVNSTKGNTYLVNENLLRIEIGYKKKRKLPNGIFNLADLISEEGMKAFFYDLINCIMKIEMQNHYDYSRMTSEERAKICMSFNSDFLIFEKNNDKKAYSRLIKEISQIKEKTITQDIRKELTKLLNCKYIELCCS